jgi:hypothetical protein
MYEFLTPARQHVCYLCTCYTFWGFLIHNVERYSQNKILRCNITPIHQKMAYHKRSMKHRKSSRRHLKARRTRARRGGKPCARCGKEADDYKYCEPCATALRRQATNSANNPN